MRNTADQEQIDRVMAMSWDELVEADELEAALLGEDD